MNGTNYFASERGDQNTPPDRSASVETLSLSTRACNILTRNNVQTIADLEMLSEADLLSFRSAGRFTVAEIIAKARAVGICIPASSGMEREIRNAQNPDDKCPMAWDVAAALFGCSDDILRNLFNTADRHYIVLHYSPDEVARRVLNIQPLLDVGDEVHFRYISANRPRFGNAVIVFVAKDRYVLIDGEGCLLALDRIRGYVGFEATGKHLDDPNEYVDWDKRAGVNCSVNGRVDWTVGPMEPDKNNGDLRTY